MNRRLFLAPTLLFTLLALPALPAFADRTLSMGEELQAACGAGGADNGGWRAYSAYGGGFFFETGGDIFAFRPSLLFVHQNTAWLDSADSRPEEHHLGQLQIPLIFKFSAPMGSVRPCMLLGPRVLLTLDDTGTPSDAYRWHVPVGFSLGMGCDVSVPGGSLQVQACYDQDGDELVFGNPGFVRLSLAYAFEMARSQARESLRVRRQRLEQEREDY
jgi:hypothetical protein